MYELILGLCNWVASLPMFIVIILIIAVNILKLIVTVRQLYAQEACERFGFAMTSRIFSWISFLSTAMYSWSVYYDHETGSDEKHFLIIGLVALALSVVFGFIAKSVKLPVMNILLTACAVLSGGMFGVALYSWPSFIAIIVVLALDVVICAIAQKAAEKAPDSGEVKQQHIINSFRGISKEYYQLCSNYLQLPNLSDKQQLIVASCNHADFEAEAKMAPYKRIWMSGSILWLLKRKGYSRINPYYTETETVDKGSFQYERPVTKCDKDVKAAIESYTESLDKTLNRVPDYSNDVIRLIDAAKYLSSGDNKERELYVWDAAHKKIGIYDSNVEYTDAYIAKRNKDTDNTEYVRAVLTDLQDYFVSAIDLRYKETSMIKLMSLAELPFEKRIVVWYVSVCLGEQNPEMMTDASLVCARIKQLESMMTGSGNNQYWDSLFKAYNTAIENLGGNNATRFNAILNDWQRYRPAFVETIHSLK